MLIAYFEPMSFLLGLLLGGVLVAIGAGVALMKLVKW